MTRRVVLIGTAPVCRWQADQMGLQPHQPTFIHPGRDWQAALGTIVSGRVIMCHGWFDVAGSGAMLARLEHRAAIFPRIRIEWAHGDGSTTPNDPAGRLAMQRIKSVPRMKSGRSRNSVNVRLSPQASV